ncbi:TetR/AcrR family transcriptional regulator [Thermobifida alba]|uniref:TetR/AcrR family transcriptional regulator n=1 Tax=Thermobifida alba TaxID=53522 RepID=A0ABY4L040_THEAE|nr:TetR/AcrR family transcriptional regulator [Thermobifida alba]UPT20695.1 TetR/AcrR family transcriptional regulator [Thermobifida alba]HLU96178.1 TetR/AcrR family transcriptional regulator [Thermobifida alba]
MNKADTARDRQERRHLSTDQRRRDIVATAADLFDRNGYVNTSMQDIARAAGIAKPTLYHYFTSKDEILCRIHEEFIDQLLSRHENRLAARLRPDQLVLEVMADILELMETHRGHVRVFFENHRELPEREQAEIRLKRDRYQTMVEETFAAGTAEGLFRDVDPRTAALALFGMCNWAYQWYRKDGTMRTRDLAYVFWDYLVHGVGAGRP